MKTNTNFRFILVALAIGISTGLFAQKKDKKVNPKKILSKAREAVRVEEYHHAMPFLEQLDTLLPQNREVHYLFGVALMNLNRTDEARSRFVFAATGEEKFENINYYLAKSYHLEHNFDYVL